MKEKKSNLLIDNYEPKPHQKEAIKKLQKLEDKINAMLKEFQFKQKGSVGYLLSVEEEDYMQKVNLKPSIRIYFPCSELPPNKD